jgi:hypothetical protein
MAGQPTSAEGPAPTRDDYFSAAVVWLALPLVTFGMATPLLLAGAAIRRKSWVAAVLAVGFGAAAVPLLSTVDEPGTLRYGIYLLAAMAVGAAQLHPAAKERRAGIERLSSLARSSSR